jgi:hypothetical protein
MEQHTMRFEHGVTVRGVNETLVKSVVHALRIAGVPEVRPEFQTSEWQPGERKYELHVGAIQVRVGHTRR